MDISEKPTPSAQTTALIEWVTAAEANGIKQHTAEWLAAKKYTIGGSSLATLMGVNPYSNVHKMMLEKIGVAPFVSGTAMHWGNLFEDVIKRYVERDRGCVVVGEDLYVDGPPNTSYSPDGLAVMFRLRYTELEHDDQIEFIPTVESVTVLVEFKCPWSRIPTGSVPKYYLPQVRMGLDIIEIADVGLFIEGVFRRCAYEHIGNNAEWDKGLTPRSSGDLPLAFGVIGFYLRSESVITQETRAMIESLMESQTVVTPHGVTSDLGVCSADAFAAIMHAWSAGAIEVHYGGLQYVSTNAVPAGATPDEIALGLRSRIEYDDATAIAAAHADTADFMAKTPAGYTRVGVLPWKLFRIDYNWVERVPGFLSRLLPRITSLMDTVRACIELPLEQRAAEYSARTTAETESRFSD